MDETKEKKQSIRNDIAKKLSALSDTELSDKLSDLENRLFEFANFVESKIPLLYLHNGSEVKTARIIEKSLQRKKVVILPVFKKEKHKFQLFKIDSPDRDIKLDAEGFLAPDMERCKEVPVECLDIALIPSVALDEKGGRIGSGDGHYDRLIPKLPATARKVAIAFEFQIVPQVPMQSHDRHVDIIVTDKRVIYKI